MTRAQAERERQRQIRRKQRERRLKKRRVMRNRIILVFVLFIIIAAVVLIVRSCGRGTEKPKTETETEAKQETEQPQYKPNLIVPLDDFIKSNGYDLTDTDTVTEADGTVYVKRLIEVIEGKPEKSIDTDYVIRVNLAYQCVTVYRLDDDEKETPVRAFPCSTARGRHVTPEGDYYMSEWYDWCYLVDGSYGQYAYRLSHGNDFTYMFHSVPYDDMSKDTLEWGDYDKLGTTASMGCVRISTADARWLCANVGYGVHVVIYSDSSSPGPLGKPAALFVPSDCGVISGWDPTDPDPANPWHRYSFKLSCDEEITIPASPTPVDLGKYIKAVDSLGNDISRYTTFNCKGVTAGFYYTTKDQEDVETYPDVDQDDIIQYHVSGLDFSKPGTYNVVAVLSIGPQTAFREITVTVREPETEAEGSASDQ